MFWNIILVDPQGIALDLDDDKVYWTDPEHQVIEMANLDGSERDIIIETGTNSYPQGNSPVPKAKVRFWLIIFSRLMSIN